MEKEKWVQINKIQGYEDVREWYWISSSDEDKIINKITWKILKVGFDKDGYKRINLQTKNNKCKNCRIHILKAKAFLFSPNPLGYNVIRHLNDIKTDNRLENLSFGTQSDNVRDCIRNGNYNYSNGAKNGITGAKKLSKPIRCIETRIIYPSAKDIGRKLGIDCGKISECCHGKRQRAGGFHWEFINKEDI